jgi:hypothetical protein
MTFDQTLEKEFEAYQDYKIKKYALAEHIAHTGIIRNA